MFMAFDFKKEYREFYMPKNKPEIINVQMKKTEHIKTPLAFYILWHIQ